MIGTCSVLQEVHNRVADPFIGCIWVIELIGEDRPQRNPKIESYFEMTVKDADLPGGVNGVNKFKGKIVSMTPANRPKEIVLAIEKPDVADATLFGE